MAELPVSIKLLFSYNNDDGLAFYFTKIILTELSYFIMSINHYWKQNQILKFAVAQTVASRNS